MKRAIALAVILGLLAPLCARDFTLDEIRSKPPSRARNFMLWQYFDQNITSEEADEAFYLLEDVNWRMYRAFAEKSDRPEVAYTLGCMDLDARALTQTDDVECVRLGASIGKLSALGTAARETVAEKSGSLLLLDAVKMMNDGNIAEHYWQYDPALFMRVFNGSYGIFKRNAFNFQPATVYMQALSELPGFAAMVTQTFHDEALSEFARGLMQVRNPKLDADAAFFLGLLHLRHGDVSGALEQFRISYDNAYYQEEKDKALFWQAKAGRNPLVWEQLAKSWDINFYSLYAKEKMKTFPDNYYTVLESGGSSSDINLSDPFAWNELLTTIKATPKAELRALAERYKAPNLLPLRSFIIERASDYRLQGFITPYADELFDVNDDTRAMIYALMRQESRFIPGALSRSYALGLMQMMPFLCRAMDDQVDCGREALEEMFDPHVNLLYAKPHIAWLKARVYHPLFIAYAYNGGIGYTKRYLEADRFKPGPYEPFMSMEIMRNVETREYGKKVLANYVVYKRIFGEPVSLIGLCKTLLDPAKTDRFRSAK